MKQKPIFSALPILFGFFIMGFCDIVGISSDYVQRSFRWSPVMTGFVPSLVFIWFLFLSIPVGNQMNRWGRKNTVLLSMGITVVGMLLPLVTYNSTTCMLAYALLGIGNAILQVSLNPLLNNVITDDKLLVAESQVSLSSSFALLKNQTILQLFLGIFFIVGVDVGTNYISSKLMAMRFGWDEDAVKFAPQVYFFCRTIGALIGVFALSRVASIKYFRVNILCCIAALLVMLTVEHDMVNLACIGAVGFFASSVFSIIYSKAIQAQPDKANQISGLMITAVAGGGVVTPVIGFAIGAIGIIGGILVTLCCVLYLTYCAFGHAGSCMGHGPF